MRDTCSTDGCAEPAHIHDTEGSWCDTHWDAMEAAKHEEERQATEAAGGPWPQTCPRRGGEIGPWERGENLDTWDIREQMHNGLRARHCSFCGSLHPDDFMHAARDGVEVGPTDKSYKVYVDQAHGGSKFYFQHLSPEQRQEFIQLLNDGTLNIGYPGHFYVAASHVYSTLVMPNSSTGKGSRCERPA